MPRNPAGDLPPCLRCSPTSMAPLPPFGSCARCLTQEGRKRLLEHERANRSCPVCGKPLPVAAIHLKVHADCRVVSDGQAA